MNMDIVNFLISAQFPVGIKLSKPHDNSGMAWFDEPVFQFVTKFVAMHGLVRVWKGVNWGRETIDHQQYIQPNPHKAWLAIVVVRKSEWGEPNALQL
jgi:hypothetical protein